jgi:putative ABC transport system permease protein
MLITASELINSADIGLVYGIVAAGIYLTFRTINFTDMACDGSFVLGAATSTSLIKIGLDPYTALAASVMAGCIAGCSVGFLNIKCKMSDLLSGIVVAFMLYSINLRIMGDSPNIVLFDEPTVYSKYDVSFAAALLVCIGVVSMLFSRFGLRLRAVGYNRQFAMISCINVKFMTVTALAISNAMIAFSGGLFSQYQGFCDITQGTGTLIAGLASIVIGESLFRFKRAPLAIISCIAGSVAYRIIISVALHADALNIRTQDLNLITGLIMITIIAANRRRNVETN